MEEEVVLPIGTKIIIKKSPWRTSKSEFEGHLVTIISSIYSESYEETLYKIGADHLKKQCLTTKPVTTINKQSLPNI